MIRHRPVPIAMTIFLTISLAVFSQQAETRNPVSTNHLKRALGHDAYDIWNRIEGSSISNDGKWILYGVRAAARNANAVLQIQSTGSATKYLVVRGEAARFSEDSQFVAYVIKPDRKQLAAARRGSAAGKALTSPTATRGGGGPEPAGRTDSAGDASRDEPKDELEILNLATGEKTRIDRVKSFQMPRKAAGWLVYQREKPKATTPTAAEEHEKEQVKPEKTEPAEKVEPKSEPKSEQKKSEAATEKKEATKQPKKKEPGTELVLRNLATSAEFRFSNVVSYAISENGQLLAFIASAVESDQDGVFVVTPGSGDAKQIASGRGHYKSLVIDKSSARVAFLSDRDDYEAEPASWSVYHWAAGSDQAIKIAAAGTPGVADGWWISDRRAPTFSKNGKRLFFATAKKPPDEPKKNDGDDEPKVNLDVWHWQDPYLQPMQLIRRDRDAHQDYLAVAHLDDNNRVVQLADASVPDIQLGSDGDADRALAISDLPYRLQSSWDSPGYSDVYELDLKSGSRKQVLTAVQSSVRLSPAAKFLFWWDGQVKAWMTMAVGSAKPVNVSELIPHSVHDLEHDTPQIPRAFGSAGWLTGDTGFVIYDAHDLWLVDPTGTLPPSCVTDGVGRRRNIRFRHQPLDPDEDSLDPGTTLLLSAFHLHDKSTGYFRDVPRGMAPPEELVMAHERMASLVTAKETKSMLFTRSKFETFPDLWTTDSNFQSMQRVSDANPQQQEYRWGAAELVEWTSTDGETLQGVLCKPEGFDPNRKYPMIVYFYERLSNTLHQYTTPAGSSSSINRSFYVSRDYLVFMPDIPYIVSRPGQSAMNAVVPGILSLVNRGFVDRKRIGVQGHSWGGYQIAYMVTKTDLFACAESGAPVSNMTSAYGGIRWSSGMSRMHQYERTQSRIGATLWDAQQKFIENSPIFWADSIHTPLLILHNDKDGAVPWYQGIELFVALRRLGKPAWMLNYNGEDHGLVQPQHRHDFAIRMQQFFDHYLQGAAAPIWLERGIPAVDKGKSLGLELVGGEPPDRHEQLRVRKAERDAKFRSLAAGVMDVKKVTYASRADQRQIPAYVFQPLQLTGEKSHPALVWIHGGVHGDLDPEHYYPFLKETVAKGYVVVCPEYRGSTGYGKEYFDAVDYGGYEIDDCLSAVDFLCAELPQVDSSRLGVIGWSHGGFIALHAVFRDTETFKCAAAVVPVTNLVFRLAYKGPRYQQQFSTQERIGGLPHEKRELYIERSPVYHVHKLKTPLLVHVADNDDDVDFVEAEQLINALLVKKPDLVETKIYNRPPGGHSFNRRVHHTTGEYTRDDTPDQIDSWQRIFAFLDKHLK